MVGNRPTHLTGKLKLAARIRTDAEYLQQTDCRIGIEAHYTNIKYRLAIMVGGTCSNLLVGGRFLKETFYQTCLIDTAIDAMVGRLGW